MSLPKSRTAEKLAAAFSITKQMIEDDKCNNYSSQESELYVWHLAEALRTFQLLRETFTRRFQDTAVEEKMDRLQLELEVLNSTYKQGDK